MSAPVSACPVPADQRPINEYKSLQESWFFGWSSADFKTFIVRLGCLGGTSGFIAGPIAAASFDPTEAFGRFFLAASGGIILLVSLILLRLYLGWAYVYRRLHCETVDYEETGWYDGQSWTKPHAELAQDRLISTYQVQPILQRLKYSFGVLGLLCIVGRSLWQFC
ncbi:CGLD27 family protein [Altericista sp. CCNU0014]|uniref:CGLD27 family protein n=1 Tax=Altericista sp. CCNU0014 TaxID=3082949 RepID=UPI00384B4FB4